MNIFEILSRHLSETTLRNSSSLGVKNAAANKPCMQHTIQDLVGREQGRTCLVVGAGPSLRRQKSIERLKPIMDHFIVVATDGSLGHCLRLGVVPRYVVSLDPHAERIVRWFGDPDLTDAKLQDDYFRRQDLDTHLNTDEIARNRELLEIINAHGSYIKAVLSTSAPSNVRRRCMDAGMEIYWWNPIYDDVSDENSITRKLYRDNHVPCMNAGGNCGSAAWVLAARVLRAARAVLVGMDFAYYADTPKLNTQYYRILEEMMDETRIPEAFKTIHNPYLDAEFFTDPAYFWYREGLLTLIRQVRDCRTVNLTEGGILFGEGIDWMNMQEALDGFGG